MTEANDVHLYARTENAGLWGNVMAFLADIEVIAGFWRFGNLLYCRTNHDCFFYGERTANKLAWRFYWLSKRPRIGI